jgi:hypothetical protein
VRVRKRTQLPSDREIVTEAFAAWMNGTGYVTAIFADDMTWEITGRSAVSRKYPNTRQFVDEVLQPFGARFHLDQQMEPTRRWPPPTPVLRRLRPRAQPGHPGADLPDQARRSPPPLSFPGERLS